MLNLEYNEKGRIERDTFGEISESQLLEIREFCYALLGEPSYTYYE